MEEASGDGWAELHDDGSLEGKICLHSGDDIPLIASPLKRLLQQPASAECVGSRIIMPSEIFTSRRARWIMHRILGENISVEVQGRSILVITSERIRGVMKRRL